MTATALKVGGDEVQEWATVLGALAGGSVLAEAARAIFGRRSQRVDNVSKLEALATSIAEKATASADKRVADVEREVALLKDRDVRRRRQHTGRRTEALLAFTGSGASRPDL